MKCQNHDDSETRDDSHTSFRRKQFVSYRPGHTEVIGTKN